MDAHPESAMMTEPIRSGTKILNAKNLVNLIAASLVGFAMVRSFPIFCATMLLG